MDVPVNGADFDADRGFEPTGPDILFSLPPMMLALLVLLGLALFALGWFLKDAQSPRRRDAADSIWKAVDDALKAAMKADGGSLVGKAEEIQRVIERRLGATVKIAGGLAPGLDALKRALDGRPPDAHAHDDHGHDDHDHGHDESHGSGHDEHGAASGHGAVTQITIVNGAARGAGEGGGGTHGPAPLTPRQRDHAIRAAVSDLNERWRDKTARIDEMRAAHRELSAD